MVRKKIKLFVSVLLMVATLNVCLTGCWNSREINSMALATAMGFDKTENGIKLTMQIVNPRAIASTKSVNESPIVVYEDEGKDIFETDRKSALQGSRKINVTHLRIVIFGEEYAKEGISYALDFFGREHQMRTDICFLIAKGSTANAVLNSLTKLDTNPAIKLYSALETSDQVWAGTHAVKIVELVNSIASDGKNAVLTGVEIDEKKKIQGSIDELKKVKADPVRMDGLAVFQKDKFVGWMDENQSKGYNYICGNVKGTIGYTENKDTGKITGEVVGTKVSKKVVLKNGKPTIDVEIKVKVNIAIDEGVVDVTKEENLKKIEKNTADKIDQICNESIEKAQKDLKSDVFGFGEVIHRAYPKMWKTMKKNWNKEFEKLPVHVHTKVKVLGTGIISKTFFEKDKK